MKKKQKGNSRQFNVASFFDGMSCGQLALNAADVKYNKYFASEIDKYAMSVTQANFPDTIQIGNIQFVTADTFGNNKIDLVIGGSPCQGFSFAGKQLNFSDPRSALFFEFVRVLNEIQAVNPDVLFMLENVNMKKDHLRIISEYLGVYPVRINSNRVSAQNRDRWYWTNIKTRPLGFFLKELVSDIPQPPDKGIFLKDILQPENEIDKKYYLSEKYIKGLIAWGERNKEAGNGFYPEFRTGEEKSTAVTTGSAKQSSTYIIQHPRGKNKGGMHSKKVPTLTSNAWEQNNHVIKLDKKGNKKASQDKASCLTGGGHSGGNHSDMDIICVAMRGRKENEDSKWEQQIEEAKGNKTNSLTTVEKDNLLLIPEATKKGYTEIKPGECVDLRVASSKTRRGRKMTEKRNSLTTVEPNMCKYTENFKIRRLTPVECERLQTVPDNYTNHVSDTQRYKMLGNGWTIDIIAHIFSFINKTKII